MAKITGAELKFSVNNNLTNPAENNIIIGIRPEDFIIADPANSNGNLSVNASLKLSVVIQSTKNTGPDIFATCFVGDLTLIIRLSNKVKAKSGDKLQLNIDQSVKHISYATGNRL
ncbi:MAG: hypothetical protein HRU29_02040 [Rhizobiales bacterium]|nr:hypothetical protein [Hyphomicrobiales bacterium]NRB13157.1 hypothetical protein [Hyphomicrobiales bacterium]